MEEWRLLTSAQRSFKIHDYGENVKVSSASPAETALESRGGILWSVRTFLSGSAHIPAAGVCICPGVLKGLRMKHTHEQLEDGKDKKPPKRNGFRPSSQNILETLQHHFRATSGADCSTPDDTKDTLRCSQSGSRSHNVTATTSTSSAARR